MTIRNFCLTAMLMFSSACPGAGDSEGGVRNIILMIGDGMGFAQVRAWRGYQDDPATRSVEPSVFDAMLTGAVTTDSANDPQWVIDSAAAATAYASGMDTLNGFIGVGPKQQPLPTVLERAKTIGKGTGLVTTSQITHATPAAFAAHVRSRRMRKSIADQLLDNRINDEPVVDIMLGGGSEDLIREDRVLTREFAALGYTVVTNRKELLATDNPNRLLGVFAEDGLPQAWDRPDTVPSLREMTQVALNSLSAYDDGFFLMVEGAQIDWASHDNDIVSVISEMEDFAAAVETAVEFGKADGHTLVVVTADHETGGLSIGANNLYQWDPAPIRGMRRTPVAMAQEFVAGDEPLSAIVARSVPFELTEAESALLDAQTDPEAAYGAICTLFDLRTGSGWTSGGHTGVDVPLYAFGPGSERFRGVLPNERVGQILMELMSGAR